MGQHFGLLGYVVKQLHIHVFLQLKSPPNQRQNIHLMVRNKCSKAMLAVHYIIKEIPGFFNVRFSWFKDL